MIRNDNQLIQLTERKKELEQEIEEIRTQYSGIEADILATGLELEVSQIKEDAREYCLLRMMTLAEAVQGPLQRPFLIDHVSDLLSKLRIASGKTQTELASILGWKQSNVSRFESENYSAHSLSKVIEYASTLGIWLHVIPALTDELDTIDFYSREGVTSSGITSTSFRIQGTVSAPPKHDSNTHSGITSNVFQGNEVVV